jgi:hypothetical protein
VRGVPCTEEANEVVSRKSHGTRAIKKPVRGHRFLYKASGTFFFAFRGCSRPFDKLSGHVEVHIDSACLSVSLFGDYRVIFVQRLALIVQYWPVN